MSWGFFNKRKGIVIKSNVDKKDKEFDKEIEKCNELEVSTKKLYKGMKRCNEALEELRKMESKLAQDLSSMPLDDNPDQLKYAEGFVKTAKNIDTYGLELEKNITNVTIEPLQRFHGIFPRVSSGIKKREQCYQEYLRLKGKVEKYEEKEKNALNKGKLEQYERELEKAKIDFEAQNSLMLNGLPQLREGRITYFDPCFEALQKSQVDFYSKCCQAYGDLVETLDENSSYGDDIQDMLKDLRSLSIIGSE